MIVQPGDTISSLAKKYGVSEDDIFKANPQIGTKSWEGMNITIPGQEGSLDKTLPSTTGNHLNLFSNVLGQAVNKAAAMSNQKGLGVLNTRTKGLNMSGGSLSQIMDMIDKQSTSGFKNVYDSTMAFMKDKYQQSRDLLDTIISQKALPQFTDDQIKDFSQQNGYDPQYLLGLKQRQTEEIAGTQSNKKATREADINNLLVSKMGKDKFVSADTYDKAYHQWYSEGGSIGDFQKLFPAETWLSPQEQKRLPRELRPTPMTLRELPASTQNTIATLQSLIDQYKDLEQNGDISTFNTTSTNPLTGKPILLTPENIKTLFPQWMMYLKF